MVFFQSGQNRIFRGLKGSWRTKPARQINDFDEFQDVVRSHMLLGVHRYINDLYSFYGSKADIDEDDDEPEWCLHGRATSSL